LIREYHIAAYQFWNYMKNAKYAKLLRYLMAKLLLRGVSRSTMNLWWKTWKRNH